MSLLGKLRTFLNSYLTLTQRERRGMMLLSVVLILQAGYLAWMRFVSSRHISLTQEERVFISGFIREAEMRDTEVAGPVQPVKAERFFFDPNTISPLDWQRLGLSEKQSAAIVNYRNKGGRFRKNEDLKKMFVITPELYSELSPWIQIKNQENR
jgi:hypothetical protein